MLLLIHAKVWQIQNEVRNKRWTMVELVTVEECLCPFKMKTLFLFEASYFYCEIQPPSEQHEFYETTTGFVSEEAKI